MTKVTSERGCDKGSVVETKGSIQSRIFDRDTTLMSRRQLNITEVATATRGRDEDQSMKLQEKSRQKD